MSNKQRNSSSMGMMGHGGMPGGGEKAEDFKGSMMKLIRFMKPYYGVFIIGILFAIASTVFGIVGPKILGTVTTEIYTGLVSKFQGTGGIDFTSIGNTILLLLGLYILASIFSFVQGWLMAGIAQKVSFELREKISKKIHVLPLQYYDSTPVGDVLSYVSNDVELISTTLNQSLTSTITSLTQIIGVFVMMLSISWQMTVVAVVMLPLSFGVIMGIVKMSQKYFLQQQTQLGEMNSHIEESFTGHTILRLFNQIPKSINTFDHHNEELYTSAWKSQFFSSIMMPIIQMVSNFGYVGVVFVGAILAINGSVKVGDIQAFIQYVRSFSEPMNTLGQVASIFQSTAAASERVFGFIEAEEEVKEGEEVLDLRTVEGRVCFNNVSFGYNDNEVIIHNFSQCIEAGHKIAIVGPTGAGKTTIVKLLMRFYELQEGNITIDHKDISKVSRNSLRQLFGMVLQDTWLFNGTILDNIKYGNVHASEEDVYKAAKAARVDHFVRTQPEGYNTIMNEESSNISQGQKQLLTIARAFLKDPKILILDEATSSVDTRTEVLIQEAMEELMKGRTSFVIAHRLSTIRNADLILVLDHGDIVELGSHEDLLEKQGFYAQLYNSQFEGEEI